jgi:hypothetical protein
MPIPLSPRQAASARWCASDVSRAECAAIGSSSDLLSGFRWAPGRVGFRFVPAMRVSKLSSEKSGAACCRRLHLPLVVVVREAGGESSRARMPADLKLLDGGRSGHRRRNNTVPRGASNIPVKHGPEGRQRSTSRTQKLGLRYIRPIERRHANRFDTPKWLTETTITLFVVVITLSDPEPHMKR